MKYLLPPSTDFYLPSHFSIYSPLLYLFSKRVKFSKPGTLLSMLGCAQWGITWIITALLAICNINFTEALLWVIESTVQDWSKKHCVRGHPRCFQGRCSCCISYVLCSRCRVCEHSDKLLPIQPSVWLFHALAALLMRKQFGKQKLGSERSLRKNAKILPCLFYLFCKHSYNTHQYSLYSIFF